jgi:NADH-ubiquinone oxidoreductase chain 5
MGAFFTAFYSVRLLYLTFMSKPSGYRQVICFAYDSGIHITFVLGCLAIPSILVGFYTKDMLVGVGTPFFGTAIFVNMQNVNIFDAEFVSLFYKTLPVNLSLFGLFSAFVLYNFRSNLLFLIKTSTFGKKLYNFLNRKWFFDKMYNEYFGQFFFKFGYSVSYKFIDRGVFEILGPTGLSLVSLNIASNLHKMQSGFLYHYTLVTLMGAASLLGVRQVWLLFGFFFDYRLLIVIFVLVFFLVSWEENKEYE